MKHFICQQCGVQCLHVRDKRVRVGWQTRRMSLCPVLCLSLQSLSDSQPKSPILRRCAISSIPSQLNGCGSPHVGSPPVLIPRIDSRPICEVLIPHEIWGCIFKLTSSVEIRCTSPGAPRYRTRRHPLASPTLAIYQASGDQEVLISYLWIHGRQLQVLGVHLTTASLPLAILICAYTQTRQL
ncbi:hypothetical protein DER45DRAFT_106666 [Fusarium avenaceum]|nr:hypothetical protein DER45DRAFT_106666 [Fusarium avenaceum]